MEIGKTLYVHKREDWRAWLAANFQTADEIWLEMPNNSSSKPSLLYNDAVEEALCFGWIDSLKKKLDPETSVQRYTPRNPKSGFSQQNKERLRFLVKQDLIHPEVLPTIQPVLEAEFIFPEDILEAIQANPQAWDHYQSFSAPYRRIRVAWIDTARARPEEFQKRLDNFIKKTEENKQIGYGGIDKYF